MRSSCSATSPRGGGREWVRWVAGHFTKERASEAKTQCCPKVIATHWVSCDISITEVKNAPLHQTQLSVYVHHLQVCSSNSQRQCYVVGIKEGKGRGMVCVGQRK